MDQRKWFSYTLLAVAFAGCLVSVFALFQLGSPSWTTSIDGLSIVCVLLATKLRSGSRSARGQSSADDN